MIQFTLSKDNVGNVAYGTPFGDSGYSVNLVATGTASLVVPTGANMALCEFTPGATVYVGTSAPSAPGGAFAASNARINPTILSPLIAGTMLYFYAATASEIQVNFYSGQK